MPTKRKPKRRRKRSTEDTYFLDASVLMYAAGGEDPLREPCRLALAAAVDRRDVLVTNSEVLQEILYRYFSIRRPDAAQTVYRTATTLCEEVLPVEEKHTARALERLLDSHGLSPRDAIHVATMESSGIRYILSTDRDFDVIEGVERVDPADF